MTPTNKIFLPLLTLMLSFVLMVPKASAIGPSLQFSTTLETVEVDTPKTIKILVDTAGYSTAGVGSIIHYDPRVVTITSVKPSTIFVDYPLVAIDNAHGKLTISGIAASNEYFSGQGIFATFTFVSRQIGTSTMTFLFQPGDTTDSNIAVNFGNGDILKDVNQLQIKTTPITSFTTHAPISLQLSAQLSRLQNGLNNITSPLAQLSSQSARNINNSQIQLDPLGPIVRQPAITDPNTAQPQVAAVLVTSKTFVSMQITIALLSLSLISLIIFLLIRHKAQNQTLS